MPFLTRPFRYSPPAAAAANLRGISADCKIVKMPPRRHASRGDVRSVSPEDYRGGYASYRPVYESYRPGYESYRSAAGTYRQDYGTYRPAYDADHYPAGQNDYGGGRTRECGAQDYYGGRPREGSRAARPESGRRGGHDYYRNKQHDRGDDAYEIQSQVSQQGWDYQQSQGFSAGVHTAAHERQGYWQDYQQEHDPATYYRRQSPSYSPYRGQEEEYVRGSRSSYQQQSSRYDYQQNSYLTDDWDTDDLNTDDQRPLSKSAARSVLKRPQPSPKYLENANQTVRTLDTPRKLLVVLDLNGTLLFRTSKGFEFTPRPKVDEFIGYLMKNHRVMVWSSARQQNVNPMCEQLFNKEQHQRLVAIWGRETLRLPASAYSSKVQVYKQLSWVWKHKHIKALNSEPGEAWDQSNTVLIDDSVEKAASEPHNLICLEAFESRPDQKSSDVLGQVVKYLELLKWEKDVSAFMRVVPFAYNAGEVFDWKV